MRKKVYEIVEVSEDNNRVSKFYDIFMICVILISLFPLAFKETNLGFMLIDYISAGIFVMDYILRLITADYKLGRRMGDRDENKTRKIKAFLVYPFTPMAVIDLLSILPTFSIIASGFKILKLFRLFRTFRVFKVFKIVRYSKNITVILNVIRKTKEPLMAVCV